jgi:glycosyltransferase involved in cell wall biosynthesis
MKWLCHQLGSREHYSVPRALNSLGLLKLLQVDAWVSPRWKFICSRLGQSSLADRNHDDLKCAKVNSFTFGRIAFDLWSKIQHGTSWDALIKRNEWFQDRCIPQLRKELQSGNSGGIIVFSYSYSARRLFLEAKAQGAFCVLGQIDPGPEEVRWVASKLEKTHGLGESMPPSLYWDLWRQEVNLADLIVVNSEWSMELLSQSGVPREKMRIIPLAYERRNRNSRVSIAEADTSIAGDKSQGSRIAHNDFSDTDFCSDTLKDDCDLIQDSTFSENQNYPVHWTETRPMNVLFLGQVIARKGIFPLLEAIHQLSELPIVFNIAGPIGIEFPDWIRTHSKVVIHNSVSRDRAELLYRSADVFILPTFSDGFALTQLEALAHGLPLIVSRYCGKVVEDGVNGLVLPEVSAQAIVVALRKLLDEPGLVARLASNSFDYNEYSLDKLGKRLLALGEELVG